jgi:predicted AAA+ superfamily ATPase
MSATIKPWYAVAIPHEDIREGRLSEAVFAANLWAVVQRDAPEVYLDPEAFFAKTYLTVGLTNVLRRAVAALSGETDAGDRILSLQTSFGGGKTHSLVALWHLAKHTETLRKSSACADLRRVLGNALPERVKAVAVFTNRTCDATQGRMTPEGIRTRTLWGELALQLGGVELYREIEANDLARAVPQGLFVNILRRAAPCLILLDEIADYCVGASAVSVGDTTLADQTISFAQELTDAVSHVPGVAVVATLPASHLEVAGSEKGQEILTSLEKRFGRMSADIRPVADDEIYEVVRRRLFESVGAPEEHGRVADAYMQMYGQHRNEVPAEATRGTFRERLVAAYPFHPALIDALYLRWGSHGDFQRTRGVLRLLASIVGDLWDRRHTETQSQPLIQPCHMRWTADALHAALTRLWGAAYDSVVAADVIGGKANARLLDDERGGEYNNERIAQGLAAAILLGSFGGQGARAGYGTRDLKLCVSRPDLNWGYTDGALLTLEERAFYLHSTSVGDHGKRYWFGTRPTLTKLIVRSDLRCGDHRSCTSPG